MRGAHQPIHIFYPEAAVSGPSHALVTGYAEDLLNAASCTVFWVERRWSACTLIYILASVVSTDKTLLAVAMIIYKSAAITIAIAIALKLQHQPTTRTQLLTL